jgi:hypothetical protein
MSLLRKLGTVAELALDVAIVTFLLTSAAHASRGWLIAAIIISVLVMFGKAFRLTRVLRAKVRPKID